MQPNRRTYSGRYEHPPGFDDPYLVPDEIRWTQPELRDLFDLLDPDIEYVADSLKLLKIAGLDVTKPEIIALAIEGGHNRAAQVNDDSGLIRQQRAEGELVRKEAALAASVQVEGTSRVYYARTGNRCKIGYTANLKSRMQALMPEELLVTERGGPIREAERHLQFNRLLSHGKEWFRYEGPLVEHVEALRAAQT